MWWSGLDEEVPIDHNPLLEKINKATFESSESYNDEVYYESMESIYARLTFIAIVFFHSLIYMSTHWSTIMKSKVRYNSGGSRLDNI